MFILNIAEHDTPFKLYLTNACKKLGDGKFGPMIIFIVSTDTEIRESWEFVISQSNTLFLYKIHLIIGTCAIILKL